MSSIEKMSIQGIRSFGTGEEKKQLIAFFTPLTLILGPNGTGKTTVIECLKYMTTGEMPPGSRQGGAFIHDPKVARENEVKAQVRLQFRDVRGQVCIASRSLVATQRAKKVEMKTLEGLITRNMPDDTKQSISSKCAEMDREMVALLGVAKPVLENVIFCHQEDSNWPLSEGKALKQKFDDIFASTRYVKALEAIRKFRQEQRGQIQVFAKEISYLKQNKDKAAEIQNSLESTETKYLASKESVKELEVQLRPLEESLQKLNNQSQHIYNLNTKIEKLKSEKSQMEKSVQELRGKIENEFTGSTDDLKRALIDFESKVKEREDKLKEYEEKKADLISEAGELSEKKERLLLQQGKLKLEAEQHKKTIDKRDALIRKVAQEYDMDDYSGIITERRVAKFIKELEEKAKQFMADAKTTRERFEEKEAKKQRDLDSARSNKTKLETEQKMKADKIKENQEEIKSLNRKLSEVDASAGRLKDLERDLRRTELEVKDAEKSVNLDSLKSEVAELQKQKGELDAELKVLDAEMSKLSLESAARSQLDIFKKDRTARDEQMRKLKNKNEDSIVHLLGRMPTDNLKRCFDDYVLQKASALNQERTSMQQMQRKLTESETNRKMTMEQLRKKEEELKSHQDDLMEVCESENFDDGLQNLQDKLRKQQDMKGTLEGSAYFYKKYRSSLEKDHPACPFCYRDFEKREDVDNLIGELEKKLSQVPDVLDKVKTSIKQYEAQYNKMLEMKPVRAIMERLEQQEIPQLKTKIKGFSEQIEKLKKNVEEKDEDLESLESDETMAKGLLGDAMMIDKYQSEMRDLDRKISAQSAKLSGGDSGRTMPQVTDEKEELQLQLDNVNRNLDRKRQKISEHSEHLQKLRSTMVELKNQKVQIESDLQQRQHWEEQKLELQNEKETLTVAVQDAKEQLRPLQEKIERLFTEKEELSREKERRFDQDKEQFTKIRDRGREVGTYQKEIEKYIKEGGEQKLEKSEDKMTQLEQAAEKLEKEQKDTNSRIEKIRKDLDTQRMRKRELDDNLLLRKKQKEIQKVDEDIEELDEKLGGLDVRNLEREKRKLNAQLEELMKEKHTAQGRQRGLEDEIKRYKKELKEEQFRDADQKYRNKLIALRTTELANDDLDKYYKALDRSIMSYHRLKMEEINRIIRNLWSNTYKGHDIDTIEIRSDEDDGATSGAAKSRRSYNYRVVMIKGKTVLDMRGRCSAGQKVLASLIIRLALAETFCLNCGILALDEPTTNLDRANIESLATALVDIIRVRHAQRNFQLVVITHDEDFVELLGKSDFVEEFYKVSKTDSGWSKLSRVRIEDIHLHR